MRLALLRAAVCCGTALVTYGAWLAWPPLGFLTLGVVVALVGVLGFVADVGGGG